MQTNTPLIAVQSFVSATRDSGYKNTASALAELIDNAFEADAMSVAISLIEIRTKSGSSKIAVKVADNGKGMTPEILHLALQFGGSTRFDSRLGMGRYGMGLPNGALSQARRVEVLSWLRPSEVWRTYLDVDEIRAGCMREVPSPLRIDQRHFMPREQTGTVVLLRKCDRLDSDQTSVLHQALATELGRMFRHILYSGRRIAINGIPVEAVDPLFFRRGRNLNGARMYGPTLKYQIRIPIFVGGPSATSTVTIRFSHLPVKSWHDLSNDQKSAYGITKNAGVSIIRAGREIDYGWYFMGTKRKENYDDWWRCEVAFCPELDELFGVTHNKQNINPTEVLKSILAPDIARTARELNGIIRKEHAQIRASGNKSISLKIFQKRDHLLEPPKAKKDRTGQHSSDNNSIRTRRNGVNGLTFTVRHETTEAQEFYSSLLRKGKLQVTLNEAHPFFTRVYSPAASGKKPAGINALDCVLLLLISAARSERMLVKPMERAIMAKFRKIWADTITVFLS